jgi:hypothetical protein
MKTNHTFTTQTVTKELPALQITLSVEDAQALRALGATSQYDRCEMLAASDPTNHYEHHDLCARLLGNLFLAADYFLQEQGLR